jgi:hypothetical protein
MLHQCVVFCNKLLQTIFTCTKLHSTNPNVEVGLTGEHMKICDECETVAHCTKHGCVPKQPAPSQYGSPELQAMIVARAIEKDRAAQPAPVQPVAWAVVGEGEWGEWVIGQQFETNNPPNHEYWENRGYLLVPLYTTPPAQPAPVKPDWKSEYLRAVELHCVTLDELREADAWIKNLEKLMADQDKILQRQTARIVELQEHIENFDGEER